MNTRSVRDLAKCLSLVPILAAVPVALGQIVVNSVGGRPLVEALDTLERHSGLAINYEDVPYQNQADVEDISTPQQRALYPTYHLLVPRKGQVSATLSPNADNFSNVNLLLISYRQNHLPGDFTVEQANGTLYVIATKVLAANGVVRDVTSPMKAMVTLPYAERSVRDTIIVVLSAVFSATGIRIEPGELLFWPTHKVSFGAPQAAARDVLASLFAKVTTTPLSYRLLYDPLSGYMLNVQAVATGSGSTSSSAAPAPSQQPNSTGRPVFKKQ